LTHSIRRSLIGQRAGIMVTQGIASSDVASQGFKAGLDVDEEKCRSLRRNSPRTDFGNKCQSIVSRQCISLG
jgi:hypothetical protein